MVSAGFVHLLGAAIADLNPNAVFPIAPFLCGLGFILTLVADHTAEKLSSMSPFLEYNQLPDRCIQAGSVDRCMEDYSVLPYV